MGDMRRSVAAVPEHGIATIWDADLLIGAASQIVEALDFGRRTSRLRATMPYEILRFIARGKGMAHNEWLKVALDRLQPATIELILPDWFNGGVLDRTRVLSIARRGIVRRKALPGYELSRGQALRGDQLDFVARPDDRLVRAMRRLTHDPAHLSALPTCGKDAAGAADMRVETPVGEFVNKPVENVL
jgi:plasmid replication initiation protein